jgi:hypothetical protein
VPRVEFDPNVRCAGNGTYLALDALPAGLALGADVDLVEPESGQAWPAQLYALDQDRGLAYLTVRWTNPHPAGAG